MLLNEGVFEMDNFSYENFITTTHFEPKKEYKSLGGVDLKNILVNSSLT